MDLSVAGLSKYVSAIGRSPRVDGAPTAGKTPGAHRECLSRNEEASLADLGSVALRVHTWKEFSGC